MNDDHRPDSGPIGGAWESNPWIIIDDTEDDHVHAADPAPPTADGPPDSQKEHAPGKGWDSFTTAGSWHGMNVSPPGGGRGSDTPKRDGNGATASAASAWASAGSTADGARDTGTVRETWSFEEGDLDDGPELAGDDGAGFPEPQVLGSRLSRLGVPAFGPGFVTLATICVGALLVISSILWHPHVP